MFNADADLGDQPIVNLIFGGQVFAPGLLFGLSQGHIIEGEALKAGILIDDAAFGQVIVGFISHLFVVLFTFTGQAEEEDSAHGGRDHHILNGMAFFLAAIVEFLVVRVHGTRNRAFGPIVKIDGLCHFFLFQSGRVASG